jgi:hypothetical protein
MREAILFLAAELQGLERRRSVTAERQRRYRERHRNGDNDVTETLQRRYSNADITLSRVEDNTLSSLTSGEGLERKEERTPPPPIASKPLPSRGTRLPIDFEPDASCAELAEKLLLSRAASQQAFEEFCDYWRGVPGSRGTKLDWQATFRNQLRRMKGHTNGQAPNGHKPGSIADGWAKVDAVIAEAERRENEGRERNGQANIVELPRLRQGIP